ncbi:MAG: amino acid adenylation domain-containing protein [Ruminococcaceae bacterium]|nr:amino acid adenylation domain-containing protein [Oscillospiraceae bacterium]
MPHHVLTYLEESFRKYPNRIALADAKTSLTYAQVHAYVTSFGSGIHRRIGGEGRPVAVCLRHNVYDVLAFFSVAYSGNFYVPVDTALPADRIGQMMETIAPAAVLAGEGTRVPDTVPAELVWRQEDWACDAPLPEAPWKRAKDTDVLYVIFTSGSTGVPKGVAVAHRSVIDMAEQFCAVFGFPENAVFGNQAPFDFDVSVKDIYLSLKVGGRLEILEKKLFSFPKLLIERLNERQVDTVIWAVPALKIMSALDAFAAEKPLYLRDIMFSGEVMPPKTLAYWQEKIPDARYVNLYGPTEITCNCTYYIVEADRNPEENLPIGTAFPNCSVFLLEGDEPVAEGESGEICVAGSCLALGYYNAQEQTDAAFVQNPLRKCLRETIYRTGDIGRVCDGKLLYMGRRDAQIKHMGHRIELSEIELCANTAEGVSVSACVYDADVPRIVLFYQGSAEEKAVFAHLRGKLPKYMLPAAVEKRENFPQTRTGKIDRKALFASLVHKEN